MTKNLQVSDEDRKYLNMIYSIAHKFSTNPRCELDDYVSVGLAALWKARAQFDPAEGVKFSTYAYTVIENDILQEFQDSQNVLAVTPYKYKQEGVKEETDFVNRTVVSLEKTNQEGLSVKDLIPAESGHPCGEAERKELIDSVHDIIDRLPSEEKKLVVLRTYEGMTLNEIAAATGMTRKMVFLRLRKINNKLKFSFKKAGLEEYATGVEEGV